MKVDLTDKERVILAWFVEHSVPPKTLATYEEIRVLLDKLRGKR